MDLDPQDASGPPGAAHWTVFRFPRLDEAELAEILAAGNTLPGVEDMLRRLVELEISGEDDLWR